jgi:hypothetical protein
MFFNCDGLRTPSFGSAGADGFWGAVATMPTTGTNVDLRFHEISTGAKDGFAQNLGSSGWGPSLSDFVLVDFRSTAFRSFDVGVLDYGGSGSYTIHTAASKSLGGLGAGSFGPYSMAADRILDLYDLQLVEGLSYDFRLENLSGSVDWGMTLYAGGSPFLNKSAAMLGGTPTTGGPGEDEMLNIVADSGIHYALAIWKNESADMTAAANYMVHVSDGVTSTPELSSPRRAKISSIHPNPFNPRTTVNFSVAFAGHVKLDVYNLHGQHVRTLLSERMEAGQHEFVWDGRDDHGDTVSSGVYAARLRTSGYDELKKMVLVK